MAEHRRHQRMSMTCRVRLMHPNIGERTVEAGNISDAGIFLLAEDLEGLEVGTIVQGQVLDMAAGSPQMDLEVRRFEPDGVGLRICE